MVWLSFSVDRRIDVGADLLGRSGDFGNGVNVAFGAGEIDLLLKVRVTESCRGLALQPFERRLRPPESLP